MASSRKKNHNSKVMSPSCAAAIVSGNTEDSYLYQGAMQNLSSTTKIAYKCYRKCYQENHLRGNWNDRISKSAIHTTDNRKSYPRTSSRSEWIAAQHDSGIMLWEVSAPKFACSLVNNILHFNVFLFSLSPWENIWKHMAYLFIFYCNIYQPNSLSVVD